MTPTAPSPLLRDTLGALAPSWWVLLIYGLVAIGFGVMAITSPVSAAIGLAWAMGLMALIEGAISLFALFGRTPISKGWLALYGVASVVFGLLALLNPVATASVLVLLLAAWLIVGGLHRIVFAIRVRQQIEGEWLLILSGVLAIVLGVLFAANPLAGMAVTSLWIGIGALVYGVLQVMAAFKLRRYRNS